MTSPAADLLEHLLSPLAPWLDAAATQDVAINRPGEVWVYQGGSWHRHHVPELDFDTLEELTILAGALRRQEVGTHSPILDTELPGRERFHASLFPTVDAGTISITIRKPGREISPAARIYDRYVVDGWNQTQERRSVPHADELLPLYDAGDAVEFLCRAVRCRQNILLVGATGAGKTELLRTLCAEIDHGKRIVTIEDAAELVLNQPNQVRMLFRRDDLAKNVIDAEILIQAGMRMRPDVMIIGEMRGKEAFIFVRDVAPSHPGSLSSVHAHDTVSGLARVFNLCKAAPGASMDDRTLAALVVAAIDVVVPLRQEAGRFQFGHVWYVGDARRRGETAMDLFTS